MRTEDRPACALCLRRGQSDTVPVGTQGFCPTCAATIGRFALEASARGRLWSALDHRTLRPLDVLPLQKLVLDEIAALKSEAKPRATMMEEYVAELSAGPIEEEFGAFKNGLDRVVHPDDAATRVDLAIAYREMGLIADALEEAARALQHQAKLPPGRAALALNILLDPKVLRKTVDEALELLRELLFAN